MKLIKLIRKRWQVLADTVIRYPLTLIALFAAVITNIISINMETSGETEVLYRLVVTFVLAAAVASVLQLAYERFGTRSLHRKLLMGLSIILAGIYYLTIIDTTWQVTDVIRTVVIFFVLLVAFLWIPVIRNDYNLNESFMAAFKGFFMTTLIAGVLFLGVVLILGAMDMLLIDVDEKAFLHSANIIFILLAPIYFLSLIPRYPGRTKTDMNLNSTIDETIRDELDSVMPNLETKNTENHNTKNRNAENQNAENYNTENRNVKNRNVENHNVENYNVENHIVESRYAENRNAKKLNAEDYNVKNHNIETRKEAVQRLITPGKFLESLVSYIIIPITLVFTIILIIYILTNITDDFWSDNLMEPLLVSYSITVILVYLLAATLKNRIAFYFRLIFPKILVPIVLFQTIASILKIGDAGITYGRYYAILFGIFATIAGVWFSLKPVKKNGFIAPILIILALISIIPPIDSFTISRASQTTRLKRLLLENQMLERNTVIASSEVSKEDREAIVSTIQYLNRMDYTKDISFLEGYVKNHNFETTFGFPEYEMYDTGKNLYLIRDGREPISIEGYDRLIRTNVYKENKEIELGSFEVNENAYTLNLNSIEAYHQVIILSRDQDEIIRMELDEFYDNIYDRFATGNMTNEKTVATEEVTFTKENEQAVITVVAENINISEWNGDINRYAELYILIKVK